MTRSRVVVVAPCIQAYARTVVRGILAIGASRDWVVRVIATESPTAREDVHESHGDVTVLIGVADEFLPELSDRQLILAAPQAPVEGYATVMVDETSTGRLAAEQLASLGLRHVGSYVTMDKWFARQRETGFLRAIEAMTLVYHPQPRPEASGSLDAGADVTMQWLCGLPKPAGIVAACPGWAAKLVDLCHIKGIRVPEDLAIISCDDDDLVTEYTHPPISAVSLPWMRIGTETGLMVERTLHGDATATETVVVESTSAVARRSTDMVAVADPDVAAALAFIRSTADRVTSVSDVIRHVIVYRKRLERAFRRHVGRSILHEIHRVHVERAKSLLIATDLPIGEVAARSGWSSEVRLRVAFKRLTGMTPSEFRARFQER